TLAFARVRRSIFTVLAPLSFLGPVALALALPLAAQEYVRLQIIIFGPLLTRGSACLVVLLQAYFLTAKAKIGFSVPVRVRRLYMLVLGDAFATVFYVSLFHDIAHTPQRLYWLGFDKLVFMLYFCAVALSDYSAEGQLVQNTPVSEYHRRAALPESVSGAVHV